MSLKDDALRLHKENKGKFSVASKITVKTAQDLSLAYTPGVAEPCKEIFNNLDAVYDYTSKGNMIAVVSDGTAVLGLGDIGPYAAIPVMEGKAILFKEFAGIDAVPICINTKDVDEIVNTVKNLAPSFGGINLEDIKAPKCFLVEERLKKLLDIPVFHDDQHGTAVVVLAALKNALRLACKRIEDIKIVINGAGSAGTAIAKLLLKAGAFNIVMCDKNGILVRGDAFLNDAHKSLAEITNPYNEKGLLRDAIKDADVFIGVSAANAVDRDMVKSMAKKSIVFAMANPVPEIMPDDAIEVGAYIVGTGRSDYPNQINNVLAFPGIFRGALDVRARDITENMMLAASDAIAGIIEEDLRQDYIIPKAFDKRIVEKVAQAVADEAIKEGVAK